MLRGPNFMGSDAQTTGSLAFRNAYFNFGENSTEFPSKDGFVVRETSRPGEPKRVSKVAHLQFREWDILFFHERGHSNTSN
jgi:hypothetical protein